MMEIAAKNLYAGDSNVADEVEKPQWGPGVTKIIMRVCQRCMRNGEIKPPYIAANSYNKCDICLEIRAVTHDIHIVEKANFDRARKKFVEKVTNADLEDLPLYMSHRSPLLRQEAERRLEAGK